MKTRLLHLWGVLTSTYWFIPSGMLAAAAVGAFVMLQMDRTWNVPLHYSWIYTGGPEGARSLLSTVAGSVITVAGVVFSITTAALVQASSQFGPRLLRNFMRDRGNQFVLGTFVATFFYCLLILRSVRGLDNSSFVPNLSVTFGVFMAVGSLAVLIYFIDHVSRSLQAPEVVAAVGTELARAIKRRLPVGAKLEVAGESESRPTDTRNSSDALVFARSTGYLQAIDEEGLLKMAECLNAVIYLECRPGDFVMHDSPLLRMEASIVPDEKVRGSLVDFFFLGSQRTEEQDVEYSIRQLVEIGVRALSPGINDPFTAINCIDWLGASIGEVARHGLPGASRYDSRGVCRVVAKVSTFSGLTDAAFNQLRQFGANSVAVNLRLFEVIAGVAGQLHTDKQRQVLQHHADMVYRQCCQKSMEPADLAEVQIRYDRAASALRASPKASSAAG